MYIGPAELPPNPISIHYLNLEIVLCGYNTMKMNSDDKFNVVIAFEISALLCWIDPPPVLLIYPLSSQAHRAPRPSTP